MGWEGAARKLMCPSRVAVWEASCGSDSGQAAPLRATEQSLVLVCNSKPQLLHGRREDVEAPWAALTACRMSWILPASLVCIMPSVSPGPRARKVTQK